MQAKNISIRNALDDVLPAAWIRTLSSVIPESCLYFNTMIPFCYSSTRTQGLVFSM